MLIITKIFNNNAVLTLNENDAELVVLGKGIAYGKKIGDPADENLIEKTFSLNTSPFATRLTEILSEIPEDYFRISNQIVNYATKRLDTTLSQGIYVSLTDHIYHAVQRVRENHSVPNALTFEIQRIYKKEFEIGRYAVRLIRRQFDVDLGEDEAAFIALHIFNARTDTNNMTDTYRSIQIIKDILNLVSHYFHHPFDADSIDYQRFVTHLQHFSFRLFRDKPMSVSNDDFLYQQTKRAYPQAYHCVEKINRYFEKNFNITLNMDEQLYLVIHIQRVVRAQELEKE